MLSKKKANGIEVYVDRNELLREQATVSLHYFLCYCQTAMPEKAISSSGL